jgi:hypothetical protein
MNGETSIVPKLVGFTAIFVVVMGVLGYLATLFPGFADGATRLTSNLSAVERVVIATEPQTYRCRISKEFEIEKTGSQVRTTHHLTVCGSENTSK